MTTTSFDDVQDKYYEEMNQYMKDLAVELGVSVWCAEDVWYLRTRSRHTSELEAELIDSMPQVLLRTCVTEDTQAYIRESCADTRG